MAKKTKPIVLRGYTVWDLDKSCYWKDKRGNGVFKSKTMIKHSRNHSGNFPNNYVVMSGYFVPSKNVYEYPKNELDADGTEL